MLNRACLAVFSTWPCPIALSRYLEDRIRQTKMNRIRRRLSRRRQSSSSNRTSLSSSGKNRNTTSHHLVLISDTQDFDRTVIRRLEAEGFNTRYIPFVGTRKDIERDRKDVENLLNELEDDLESGERYAVIGTYICRECAHRNG